jgi:ubiquinone biosynthesis protein UbiJ
MAEPNIKELVKRVEALEKLKEKYDKRWEALGDAVGENSQVASNFNEARKTGDADLKKAIDALADRVKMIEQQLAKK